MQLGEVAASMGMLSDEVSSGMYAGHRSARSARSGRMAMQADARRKGEDGLTIGERAHNRRLDRRMRRAERGNLAQRTVKELRHTQSAGRAAIGIVSKELTGGELRRAGVAAIRRAMSDPGELVSRAAGPAITAGRRVGGRAASAGRRELMRRVLPQDHGRQIMRLKRGNLRFRERLTDDQLPAGAKTESLDQSQVWARLRDGYEAQRNDDGTVTYWKPAAAKREAKELAGTERARYERRRPARAARQQVERTIEHPPDSNEPHEAGQL
jgi:hypothetical protein